MNVHDKDAVLEKVDATDKPIVNPKNLEPQEKELEKEYLAPAQKGRMGLFRLIAIGNATGQSFLFNFFSAFAVNVGVSSSILGFITSIRNLMSSLFQGTFGRLSDRIGRRLLLLIGFFASFSIMVILIFINNPVMLIIISIVQATALSIIIPIWNATLGDVTRSEERARFIGGLSAMGTAVSVSSMLVLAAVFNFFDNHKGYVFKKWFLEFYIPEKLWPIEYGVAFGIAALNFLLCVVGVFFLRETGVTKKAKKKQPSMFLALKNEKFKRFFIVNSFFGLIMATMWPIFPIAQVSILNMGFTQIAIINAVFSICSSIGQLVGGKLGDKFGRKPLIIYGRMIMFTIPIIMIGAVLINNWTLLFLSNILGGTGMGVTVVAQNAYILDIAPRDQMGAYSGLNQVGWGITTFLGSLSMGFIADAIESRVGTVQMIIITFTAIAILRFLASIGYFFIQESLVKDIPKERRLEQEEALAIAIAQSTCEEAQFQSK